MPSDATINTIIGIIILILLFMTFFSISFELVVDQSTGSTCSASITRDDSHTTSG